MQIDGSRHAWLEERAKKATLLVFVDDATSQLLALKFVEEESFLPMEKSASIIFRK